MEITYKELFEKSKDEPRLQSLVGMTFTTSLKMASKAERILGMSKVDAGGLMLKALSTIAGLEGFTLTGRDEITAEYMAEILNSYGQ
ncbi:hypothetical protein LCGC14_1410440 [marine sediment metagenome]|uniref:Uncharacterized protein n=1 Tax=marine sediment metagenome TaxID=412755 RepID=A0A0F9KFG8_9ZZZZ